VAGFGISGVEPKDFGISALYFSFIEIIINISEVHDEIR
jgi:hypothetical protein